MNLEYYLYCRKSYENIIRNLEDIIYNYDCIFDKTSNKEFGNEEDYLNNKFFFMNKLKYTEDLKNICTQKINELCLHNFVEDYIDITPDVSKQIVYCTICEYTKN